MVGVGEEWDLLPRHKGVVQIDASDTRGDEFRGLLTSYGIHRWTANLHFPTLNLGAAIDGVSIGVEEASRQLLAHLQRGSLAKEDNFRIGRDAARALKYLQGHVVAHNLHYLSQLAVDGRKLVISDTLRFKGDGGLRNLAYLGVYLLKSCSHNIVYAASIALICETKSLYCSLLNCE